MTRRENMLRALRREPHAWMPAYFPIDSFNIPSGLPAGVLDPIRLASYSNPEQVVEASGFLGLDAVLRVTPPIIEKSQEPYTADLGRGRVATVWETPRGRLTQVAEHSGVGETSFIVEHPVRTVKDYGALLWHVEKSRWRVLPEGIADSRRFLQIVGNDGIAYAVGPATPIMDLVRTWVGLEGFVYHLQDEKRVVEEVLDVCAEDACRQWELIAANSPCEVLVMWDDANSLSLSREMFELYSLPGLTRFAQIAHRHGKLLVNHTCGKLAAFLDLYALTGNDAIDWLTPPPTGDTDPAHAASVLGSCMAIEMALAPPIVRYGSPSAVREHLRAILKGSDGNAGFILMAPTPNGTPAENVKAIVRELAVERGFPVNRSQRLGCILDER